MYYKGFLNYYDDLNYPHVSDVDSRKLRWRWRFLNIFFSECRPPREFNIYCRTQWTSDQLMQSLVWMEYSIFWFCVSLKLNYNVITYNISHTPVLYICLTLVRAFYSTCTWVSSVTSVRISGYLYKNHNVTMETHPVSSHFTARCVMHW